MPMDWTEEEDLFSITTDVILDGSVVSGSISSTNMLRYNAGKPPLGLIQTSFTKLFIQRELPVSLYKLTADVLGFGAKKYSANNWRKGGSWIKNYVSLERHIIFGLLNGEEKDKESEISHWGHIGCNMAFLLEFQETQTGTDDRYYIKNRVGGLELSDESPYSKMFNSLLLWKDGGGINTLRDAIDHAAFYCDEETNDKGI